MVTDVNQEDPGPRPHGATALRPQGATVLCLRLLEGKVLRAGCLSSGPGHAFLGASQVYTHEELASPSSHSRWSGRCRVTALQHPPTPDFPGTCRFTEVLHPRRLLLPVHEILPPCWLYFRFTEILPPPSPTLALLTYFRRENRGPSSLEAPFILFLLPQDCRLEGSGEALFQLVFAPNKGPFCCTTNPNQGKDAFIQKSLCVLSNNES